MALHMILCDRPISQLDNTSSKLWSYDAAGNPLSDGTATFTWNAAGKLSTTVKNAKTHTYKTNGLDQRISKNGPLSAKFFFFYDPTGQLIGEYRDNSSTATPADDWLVRQETIWLEDIPVAVIRKPTATSPIQIYFIHTDHLNTPRVIVNQSNTPVWRWENTHAFGANLPDEDPDGNSQLFEYLPRFSGQYFDKETGLHYNYFRYYEPETGRYISPDPIGLVGGLNVYGYVEGNPLSHRDPLGLNPTTVIGAGAGSIVFPGIGTVVGAGVGTAVGIGIGWLIYNKPPENAHDPDGLKAPGKPGKEEGFCDPKGGEDWTRNPNGRGSGWRDANGDVWIPTGSRPGDAHGGPHWDVQTPGGGYINIYPGGKRR